VARAAGVPPEDLFGVLNMGVGMVLVVAADAADRAIEVCRTSGHEAAVVGQVVPGAGVDFEGELRFPDWV
jgi:phosphoribosylformylglycinamidine cyclo-ligase